MCRSGPKHRRRCFELGLKAASPERSPTATPVRRQQRWGAQLRSEARYRLGTGRLARPAGVILHSAASLEAVACADPPRSSRSQVRIVVTK
jgi:hypothetical protein